MMAQKGVSGYLKRKEKTKKELDDALSTDKSRKKKRKMVAKKKKPTKKRRRA
jgi:hypothetical protein